MLENRKDNAIMRRVRKNVDDVDDGRTVFSNRENLVDMPITFPIEEPENTYQEKDLNEANYDMYITYLAMPFCSF